MPVEFARIASMAAGAVQGPGKSTGLVDAFGGATGGGATGTFAEALGQLVGSVDQTAAEANKAVVGMMDKTNDVHDAMIALQRADMTLQLTVQVRNKLVSAYQDIMRMPL